MKPLSKTSQKLSPQYVGHDRMSPQYVGHDRMPVFIYWRKIIKFVPVSTVSGIPYPAK